MNVHIVWAKSVKQYHCFILSDDSSKAGHIPYDFMISSLKELPKVLKEHGYSLPEEELSAPPVGSLAYTIQAIIYDLQLLLDKVHGMKKEVESEDELFGRKKEE